VLNNSSGSMAPVRSLLLRLTALAAFLGTAAAVKHEEAPIVTVNGTLSEHFTAHVTDVQPGACVIFEAQVRLVPVSACLLAAQYLKFCQ
jgi:hypothetical protein